MVEGLVLHATHINALVAETGWFALQWQDLVRDFTDKKFFDAMLNPYPVAFSVLLLVTAILTKNKKPLMILIAGWGYSATFHYTVEGRGEGDVMFDYNTMQVSELGPLVMFFIGFIIVTGLLLYLAFVRGD